MKALFSILCPLTPLGHHKGHPACKELSKVLYTHCQWISSRQLHKNYALLSFMAFSCHDSLCTLSGKSQKRR